MRTTKSIASLLPRSRPAASPGVTCTHLVTRFDRNGERPIGLPLLRGLRAHITREMRSSGANGSLIWRLERKPTGITITAVWHADRARKMELARPMRSERQERRRRAAQAGIVNRRRTGGLTVPNGPHRGASAAA